MMAVAVASFKCGDASERRTWTGWGWGVLHEAPVCHVRAELNGPVSVVEHGYLLDCDQLPRVHMHANVDSSGSPAPHRPEGDELVGQVADNVAGGDGPGDVAFLNRVVVIRCALLGFSTVVAVRLVRSNCTDRRRDDAIGQLLTGWKALMGLIDVLDVERQPWPRPRPFQLSLHLRYNAQLAVRTTIPAVPTGCNLCRLFAFPLKTRARFVLTPMMRHQAQFCFRLRLSCDALKIDVC